METSREVETKLSVPDGWTGPHLVEVDGVASAAVRVLRLRATYWDTGDRRLARSGVTLRHRTGEGRPRWTLKTASAGTRALDRTELSVAASGTAVPAQLLDLLTPRLRGAAIAPTAVVRTVRTTTLLYAADGSELAEVVDDDVTVLRDGARVDSWRELEVERRPGGGRVAKRVLAALRAAGAGETDQVPKGVRAVGGEGPPDLPAVPEPVVAGDLLRGALARGLADLVDHDLGVRTGTPDSVHRLRVACRRLRSDLRTYRDLLADDRVLLLRDELRWLASALGAARDLEVLRERVAAHARGDGTEELDVRPVDLLLAQQQEAAEAGALAALRSERYVELLRLLHAVAVAPGLADLAQGRPRQAVPVLQGKARSRLDKAVAALRLDDADHAWHEARILAKRARYAAEAAAPALGKPARQDAKHAERLQTLLGRHQDAVVAVERLTALAEQHPSVALLCGRLVERERAAARDVRRTVLRLRA